MKRLQARRYLRAISGSALVCRGDLVNWKGAAINLPATLKLVPVDTQSRVTKVIFLDLPAWGCLWGVARRRLRHGGGQHDAIGVYDRITWNFVRYIAGYRRHMAPRVRQFIAAHEAHIHVVILRDRRAVRRYLAEVAAPVSNARVTSAGKERN
jgi:hypothetical protein